jgi:hypothetical protein
VISAVRFGDNRNIADIAAINPVTAAQQEHGRIN